MHSVLAVRTRHAKSLEYIVRLLEQTDVAKCVACVRGYGRGMMYAVYCTLTEMKGLECVR